MSWQIRRRWRERRAPFDAEQDALLLESIQQAAAERGLGPEHVEQALALHVELTRKGRDRG